MAHSQVARHVPGVLSSIPDLGERLGGYGDMDDTAIAMAAGIAPPGPGRSEMVLNWRDAEDGLPWGVLLLSGGHLSLAGAGLDACFGQQVTCLGDRPTFAAAWRSESVLVP